MVAGVDEAGRGPLAGPVIAGAVILDPARPIEGLRDSKRLSATQRDRLFDEIQAKALAWSVASASVSEIDTINILQATLLAMQRAGVDSARTLYVGDSPVDVTAARAAGVRVVVARYGYLGIDDDPDTWRADGIIDTANDLMRYLP